VTDIDVERETAAFKERVVADLDAEIETHRQQIANLTRLVAHWQSEAERRRANVSVLEKELNRERGLFPSDGVWLVTDGRRNSQRIAKLGEVPDPIAFAAIARHRDAIAAAVSRSWQQYSERGSQAPIDVADAILRALDSAKAS
jgi:uncharacterized protein YhaN